MGITQIEIDARNSKSSYWLGINANVDFYRPKLVDLLREYAPLGIVMGQELLLNPSDALQLASDLQALGITILGFDCWYLYYGCAREDTSVEFYVGDDVVWGSDPVYGSFLKVTDCIQNQLPLNTRYVSFTLDIPSTWHLL